VVTAALRRPPSLPVDRDLPGAADLLAGAGAERVARFLVERGLEPHRVEPAQAHYRPGRWLTVGFRTAAVDRASDRPVTPTVIVDCRAGAPDAVWVFPDDPVLAGLAAAADGRQVRRRLRPRPSLVQVEPIAYRPRRRAVLRYRLDGQRVLFGKVVRAKRARSLLALAGAVPAGPLRLALPAGRLAAGALVVPCVPGTSLRELLVGGRALPPPDRLAALPAALHRQCLSGNPGAGFPASGRRRVDPGTALGAAQVATRLLPDLGCAARRVAEGVIGRAEEGDGPEEGIVHGDLYENQILVDGETLGLLDLDDLGPGDPWLDAANFSAHLLMLGTSGLPAAAGVLRYREELRAALCRRLDADPAALAWREAYCLLRLASGPFRVLHPEWPQRMAQRLSLATEAFAARR